MDGTAAERTAPTEIFLVRHGERVDETAEAPLFYLNCGDRGWDPPLTQEGRRQADSAGRELLRAHQRRPFSCVLYSPCLRTLETAARIATVLGCRCVACQALRSAPPPSGRGGSPVRSFEYELLAPTPLPDAGAGAGALSGRRPLPLVGIALREVCGRGGARGGVGRSGPHGDAQRGHQGPGGGDWRARPHQNHVLLHRSIQLRSECRRACGMDDSGADRRAIRKPRRDCRLSCLRAE